MNEVPGTELRDASDSWSECGDGRFAQLAKVLSGNAQVVEAALGLTWSFCRVKGASDDIVPGFGLAQTSGEGPRTLAWPGSLAGAPVASLGPWLGSLQPLQATLALAAVNALINTRDNALLRRATALAHGNLAVFQHLRPKLLGRKVVVIGRYPGLEQALDGVDYKVLERRPGPMDLPDTAAEVLLPEADWVFVTGTSLINHTFFRLTDLACHAVTVLLGPTVPWSDHWQAYGVDFVAGVEVLDAPLAAQIAKEGGGVRLFDQAVRYKLANISQQRIEALKREIAQVWTQREAFKATLRNGQGLREIDELDARLSALDSRFKRLWDAQP